MSPEQYYWVVGGPTASGKTAFSVALAQHLDAVIINADSRQIYREIAIGTARPTSDEMQNIPHYLFGHVSVHTPYSVGEWLREVQALLNTELKNVRHVILVGGTGLYLKAFCFGLDDIPPVSTSIRAWSQNIYEKQGISGLLTYLELHDPKILTTIDQKNPRRLIRAVEVHKETQTPLSTWQQQQAHTPLRRNTRLFQPEINREKLYQNINNRVITMLNNGLKNELELFKNELGSIQAFNTVGYQEFAPYYSGEYSFERAVELVQRNTRRYAKRQLTFLRQLNPETISFENFSFATLKK